MSDISWVDGPYSSFDVAFRTFTCEEEYPFVTFLIDRIRLDMTRASLLRGAGASWLGLTGLVAADPRFVGVTDRCQPGGLKVNAALVVRHLVSHDPSGYINK